MKIYIDFLTDVKVESLLAFIVIIYAIKDNIEKIDNSFMDRILKEVNKI